jgi:hypothetical protein
VSVVHRKPWDPDRRFVVTIGSRWKRADEDGRVWTVTDLWHFEQGSGRELLAVTIEHKKVTRRLSQARLIGTMRELLLLRDPR